MQVLRVKNGARGYRDKDGVFHEFKLGGYQPKYCGIRIVLTVAHLNHDIADSSPENLAALCMKCSDGIKDPLLDNR